MIKNQYRLLIVLVIFVSISATVLAQFDTAAVLGTVKDSNGAAVAGAKVTLKNIATSITVTTPTDAEGNYQFFNVKIGSYEVEAELQGFSKALAKNVGVTINARQRVDLALKPGNVSDTLNITSDSVQILETDSSDRGQVINRQQIVNLPLNGRAYADLALLTPGVRHSVLSAQESGTRDASFNVNGLRSSLNNFVVDGVDNNFYGTSNQGFSNQVVQPSPDAVQEFKVQTNNFSAEFGRAGGAVVNVSIRSGANAIHGTVYDYVRNTSLNAIGFFKPGGGVKPVLIQNQFGGSIGGPIIKDRTFYFFDYEGFRRISKTRQTATVPSILNRQGILNADIVIPYDFVDSNGVNQKKGTVIKAGSPVPMTSFAKSVINSLPLPNLSGSPNYESLPRNKFYNDKADLKVDHNFNERLSSFVRLSHRKMNNFEAPVIQGLVNSDSNGFVRVLNQQLATGVTYTLSPTSTIEVRFGVSRSTAGKEPIGIGNSNMQELYGITGLPTDSSIAGGLNTQSISGFATLGRQNSNPQYQNPTVYNPRVNYSKLIGSHSIKTGYEYQRIHTVIEDFHPKYGQDTYSGQFSRPVATAARLCYDEKGQLITDSSKCPTATYNLADFFFGARRTYALNNSALLNYRQSMHFAYLQDDFKVNQKLTVNLGIRYEFSTPQYDKDNHLANFDPTTNTLVQAKDGSLYDRSGVHPDLNNWAPRIGIAYQVTPKTVVRSGFGISYIHFNRLGGENILGFNGPYIVGASINNELKDSLCTGNNYVKCFRPTQAGYPTGITNSSNFSTATSRVNFTPADTRTGYVQSWHLTVQREILPKLLFEVAYVGNHSVKLITLADYNQARPNASNESTSVLNRRLIQGYDFIQMSFNGGQANYNALQFKIERRFSQGLYLLNSFTWSKAIDNAAGHLEASFGDNSRMNIRNMAADRGLSNYDQPVNNTTSVVYDLPVGKGRRFIASAPKIADKIIGGWRMTMINTMTSGTPVNLTYSADSNAQVGTNLTYRPNLTGVSLYADSNDPTSYLNKAALSVPDRSQPFGTAGRNIVRGPNFIQTDLGLHKDFTLWSESKKLEFRMEAFNLFNRTNFTPPDGNYSNNSFGKISSNLPARQIQFALKFVY